MEIICDILFLFFLLLIFLDKCPTPFYAADNLSAWAKLPAAAAFGGGVHHCFQLFYPVAMIVGKVSG